jgi:quercetin dioxygenase-like cupin family protein
MTGMAKLRVLHREVTRGLPQSDAQEIRVLIATLEPGDHTPRHSHRFPVTILMIIGQFTLELEGREPVVLSEGDTFIEPSRVPMTGYSRGRETAKMALFYVSDPDVPFADAIGA